MKELARNVLQYMMTLIKNPLILVSSVISIVVLTTTIHIYSNQEDVSSEPEDTTPIDWDMPIVEAIESTEETNTEPTTAKEDTEPPPKKETSHTPIYTPPTPPITTPIPVLPKEDVSKSIQNRLLAAHNEERASHGVDPLSWSDTVAESAKEWADQLALQNCSMKHSSGPYGENLYYRWTTNTSANSIASPEEVVGGLVSEKADYDYETNTCKPGKMCGHYTQVVWSDSTELGCGRSICQTSNRTTEMWVCQYNPPGNWVSQKPY